MSCSQEDQGDSNDSCGKIRHKRGQCYTHKQCINKEIDPRRSDRKSRDKGRTKSNISESWERATTMDPTVSCRSNFISQWVAGALAAAGGWQEMHLIIPYIQHSPSHSLIVWRNDWFSRCLPEETILTAEPPSALKGVVQRNHPRSRATQQQSLSPPSPASYGSQNTPFHVCCHGSNAASSVLFWIQKWKLKHLTLLLAVKQISKQQFKIKFKQYWDILILTFISPSQVAIAINVYAAVYFLWSLWLFFYFGGFCIFRYSLYSVWTGTTSSHC